MIYDYIFDGPQKLISYECFSLTYRTLHSREPGIPPYTCVIFWTPGRRRIEMAVWSDDGKYLPANMFSYLSDRGLY